MANKIYNAYEDAIYFESKVSAGAEVVGFSPMDLPGGSGQISHPRLLGSGSRPTLFKWRAKAAWAPGLTSSDVGTTVDIYWSAPTSFGSTQRDFNPGGVASGDFMFHLGNEVRNMQFIGSVELDTLTLTNYGGGASGYECASHGMTRFYGEYARLVYWNNVNGAMASHSGAFSFELQPVPQEIQV